jgi:hypothetical protein
MMKAGFAMIALASCTTTDPCDGIDGMCVTLHVSSPTVGAIDQLELDLSWGDHHGTTTLEPGGTATLPLVTAVAIAGTAPRLAVVGAGKLSGQVLGTGANATPLADRATLELVLADPGTCVGGAHYCGGDKLAGMADTVYECNGGGVPIARGACAAGCTTRPTLDDACAAARGTCVDGGLYCGGDKLAGDPQTLYRCSGGAGTVAMECATACAINAGSDDSCR